MNSTYISFKDLKLLKKAHRTGIYHIQNLKKKLIHKLYLGNGVEHLHYIYPDITRVFYSPMLQDENLYFCGGFFIYPQDLHRQMLLERVIQKSKPMAFIVCSKIEEMHQFQEKALAYDLATYQVPRTDEKYELGFSNRGQMTDLFDIDALIQDYRTYLEPEIELWYDDIIAVKTMRLEEFLTFNYANPLIYLDYILVGLILGYPIETTAAIMLRDIDV